MSSSRASTFGRHSNASQASLRPVPKARFAEFLRRLRPRRSRAGDIESQSTNTAPFSFFSSNTGNSLRLSSNLTTAPSTAPTSASISASVASPDQSTRLRVYPYGGVYVHSEQLIDPSLQKKWDKIVSRLIVNMVHGSCGRFNVSLSSISKTPEAQPTKTVLVTCADDDQRRKVETHCKGLDWFQKFVLDNGLAPVQYVVCPNAKPTAFADGPVNSGMSVIGSGSLVLPHFYDSLCGLPLTVIGPEGSASKRCTIGGIITCNDRLYAWTTRHAFDTPDSKVPNSMWRRSARKMSSLLLRAPSTKRQVILNALFRKPGLQDGDHRPDHDYVLLDLAETAPDTPKRLFVPNKVAGRAIYGSLPVHRRAHDTVNITTATAGTFRGNLCGTPQVIVSGASVHKAYLITLDRMMVAGCSGAWVVQNGFVLGYLIAARDDLPWAYMISMDEAFEDVASILGQPARVATQDDIDCFLARKPIPPAAQQLNSNRSAKQDDASVNTLIDPSCDILSGHGLPDDSRQQHQPKPSTKDSSYQIHPPPGNLPSDYAASATDKLEEDQSTSNLIGPLETSDSVIESRQYFHNGVHHPDQSSASLVTRVRCRLVVKYMGDTHASEYDLDLDYLKSKSAFSAINLIAEEMCTEQLLLESANDEIYLVSLSCGLIETAPSHRFDLVSITDRQDWVDDVSAMLDGYHSQSFRRNFFLELQFDFNSYPRTKDAMEPARVVLKKQLLGQTRTNFLLDPYIPKEALSAIISSPLIIKLIREIFGGTNSPIYLQSAMRHFIQRAQRLLAICLITETPDSAIRSLYENGLDDADLPLDMSTFQNNALMTMPQDFDIRQWECMASEFDRKSSEERPWTLQCERHVSLPSEIVMPIHRKGKLGFGPSVQVWKVSIDPEHHNLASVKDVKYALRVIQGISDTGEDPFEAESRTLKAIAEVRHPHILTSLASWSHRSSFYQLLPLAMHNLGTYVDKVPPPTLIKESTLWLLKQLEGLSDAIRLIHHHYKNDPSLIAPISPEGDSDEFDRLDVGFHHDIKPENILVFHQRDDLLPTFKIADLGSAKIKKMRTGISVSGGVRDRICYKAPDTTSNGGVSRACDIWSLGCIMAEIIIWALNEDTLSSKIELDLASSKLSRAAFWDRDDRDVPRLRPSVSNHLRRLRDGSFNRGVFPRCIKLVERMLAIEPSRRPTASTVTKEWDVILEQATADLNDEDFYLRGGYERQPGTSEQTTSSSIDEEDMRSVSSSDESSNLTDQGTVLWSAPSTLGEGTGASTVTARLDDDGMAYRPTTFLTGDGLSDTTSSRTASDSLFEGTSTVSMSSVGHDSCGVVGFAGSWAQAPHQTRRMR